MASPKLLTLPSITALGQILGGYWDGRERFGISISTHAQLHDFFGELDVEVSEEVSISKKIRATLARMNQNPVEHAALKRLVVQVADPRYYSDGSYERSMEYFNSALRADGLELKRVGEKCRLFVLGQDVVGGSTLVEKALVLDLPSVRASFDNAIEKVVNDPAGALTAACSTVESVCKCILEEMGKPLPSNKDISGLFREVSKHLNLSPGRSDIPEQWEGDIKQILSGLISVVGGIGALRTHAGDAHGRGKRPIRIDARVARLAAHAASTVSVFLIETWQRAEGK